MVECSGSQESPPPSVEPAPKTSVPSWRPVTEIPEVPDSPPRGIKPTSPAGQQTEVEGLSLTVPEDAEVTKITNAAGKPSTEIVLKDAKDGFPRVRVRQVPDFGRSLQVETYAQEAFMAAEGIRYLNRTREEWPGAADAYVITWETGVALKNGSELPLSVVGFWIGNGQGGGWTLYATAPRGELESSGLWDLVFSARIP